jgi:HsdM N-terminal domain/N-6 DNA Methylase
MITGAIKSQIDQIWNAFWSGGISNPLEVIEQITYLLFLRRLDDLHTLEENKSARLKEPMARRVFPEGSDGIGKDGGRPYEDLRWSRFKHLAPAEMYTVVSEHVFPLLRTLGGDESTYAHHMKDARFTIPTPALLAKVVDLLDNVPMEDRDTKGDLYEYMLGKIATAGQNGQFRTPRHIIRLMVELTAPQPTDLICDPACGTAGFLVAAGEYLASAARADNRRAAQRATWPRRVALRARSALGRYSRLDDGLRGMCCALARSRPRVGRRAYRTRVAGARKSARGGRSLLAGLLRCRRCGHTLQISYSGRDSTSANFRCMRRHHQTGDAACVSCPGTRVEAERPTPGAPWRIRITDELRAKFVDEAPPDYLPMLETTLRLGVSRQTVLQRVKRGELHAVHVNRGRR